MLDPSTYITGFDTVAYSGPNLDLTLRGVRAGQLAEWNAAIYEGIPHLANMHAASLYVPKWAFAWFGVHQAWDLIIASHTLLLGAGMFWLVRRRLRLRPPAGLVATVVAVGSGMVMVRMLFFEQILVIAWVPWLLGCIDGVVRGEEAEREWRIAALAAVTALTLVAGHSQLVYEAIPLIAVWTLARALDGQRLRRFADVAAGGLVGLLLAAPQLWPTAKLAGRSANAGGRDLAGAVSSPAYSVQGRRLPATLLGDLFATVHTTASDGYENLTFVGVTGATVALVGLVVAVSRRATRWTGLGLAALGGGALVLSLGPRTFLYRAAFGVVPGFDEARVPARWSILTVIVVALLAAYGTDALAAAGRGVSRRAAVWATTVAVVVAAVVAVGPFHNPPARAVWAWAVGAVVVTATTWWSASRPRAALALIPAVLAVGELGVMNLHSAARAARYPAPYTSYRSPLTDELAARGDRVFALTADRLDDFGYLVTTLRPNANVTLGIRSVDGYDGGIQVTEQWAAAMEAVSGKPILPEQPLRSQAAYPLDPETFASFGVRWLLLDRDLVSAEVAAPAWQGPLRENGPIALYENPNYRGDAWLSNAGDDAEPLRVERPSATRLAVELDPTGGGSSAQRGGQLVVAEQWDPGWSAQVDGTPARVIPAEGLQLGVELPQNGRRVELRYRTPGLTGGVTVAGAAIAVALALAWSGRRQRRFHPSW